MPTFEVSLPDKIDSKINRVVEQGDFLNREQAIEELISRGISAYDTTESSPQDSYGDSFTDEFEQQDPAMQDDPADDRRSF